MAKFAHHAQYIHWKGNLRIQCACGKNSPIFRDFERENEEGDMETVTREQQAEAWYENHTGLRELRPKVRES